ncbi:uncharacterized protein LOC115212221 [Octopus sinensis]|uniref:Uncharacterized protein LOC115212221 n=1 Tax=Octopus sinensis TaxID=2607531 RepID=A0A6P7SG40_9MOLL|nr:uncharacterized protein LOC115212221 [Octopus sinensis]
MRNILFLLILSVSHINALNSTTAEEIQNDFKTTLQDEVTGTIRITPKLRLPGVNLPFVNFKSREHAWEVFFMSLSTCSGNKLFKAKLLYTRSIMIQSMDKFWDEPYMKILLFFPIYDFKYSEQVTIGKTFKCFHEVFSDPFDTQKTIRISDNSLIPPLTSIKLRFVPFVSELVFCHL